MRSDFCSLPWEAQQEIRQGEHDAAKARRRGRTISMLKRSLAEANSLHDDMVAVLADIIAECAANHAPALSTIERACEIIVRAKGGAKLTADELATIRRTV